ncbi:MAG TPA: hypothetical protein VG709_05945 [Actinomycetota bacterium]|nr:hypothetical protein [Actinomycetota bacterium]
MKRVFWFGVGVTAAVLAARWVRKQRARLAPANVGEQAGRAVRDLRTLVSESVAEGRRAAREKEAELRGSYDAPR